jgi:hypothetical protein
MSRLVAVSVAVATLVVPQAAAAARPDDGVKLEMRQGRPTVSGVFVNGRGPYRFLLDTGSTLNHFDPNLAQSIGLVTSFQTQLTSSTGTMSASGGDGIEVRLGPVTAMDQVFLFAGMDAIHQLSTDIQGVLGQVFLRRFDYLLDLQTKRMEFGDPELEGRGTRAPFHVVEGRPVVSTSLGTMVLDSGARMMVRFGLESPEVTHEMITVSGIIKMGTVWSTLAIDGRVLWRGDAAAVPHPAEAGAMGLLPLNLFKAVYVCNSGSYLILMPRRGD